MDSFYFLGDYDLFLFFCYGFLVLVKYTQGDIENKGEGDTLLKVYIYVCVFLHVTCINIALSFYFFSF